ncbi:hypothetical protein [Actinomadura sp. DC4]|uniref:hypothetical protein n=1 Tax=Actinomadura sp. DC4 TaxID=3055069 RepID=UPI0025B0EE07|nr:hypothetical protein [Actinomadura sp. DC4]MDN3354676.1 hypothetical protein [Actinomadura sp. DC4]
MAKETTLRPSRPVRRFVGVTALAGSPVSVLYAAMGLMTHGTKLLVPVLIVVSTLVIRPIVLLFSRTHVAPDRIVTWRVPIRRRVVPVSQVGLVEVRRGLLLEWPVLYLRDGSLTELGAPTRLWFRADPDFDRALGELRTRVRHPGTSGPYHQWSLPRLVGGPLLALTAVALVLIDPPWASDAWPLRVHAKALPDACRMLDARVKRLLPGAQVDRLLSRNDDSDPHVKRHTCQWNATHRTPGGMTLLDVGRLSIQLELDHGIGPVSDAEEAHRTFARVTRVAIGAGERVRRIPRIGDEAELIVQHPGTGFAWVTVAARKANVEEKIDLVYRERSREHEAAETATGLARLGLSEIRFR